MDISLSLGHSTRHAHFPAYSAEEQAADDDTKFTGP